MPSPEANPSFRPVLEEILRLTNQEQLERYVKEGIIVPGNTDDITLTIHIRSFAKYLFEGVSNKDLKHMIQLLQGNDLCKTPQGLGLLNWLHGRSDLMDELNRKLG